MCPQGTNPAFCSALRDAIFFGLPRAEGMLPGRNKLPQLLNQIGTQATLAKRLVDFHIDVTIRPVIVEKNTPFAGLIILLSCIEAAMGSTSHADICVRKA